jgi:ribulose-5-phosphate 4-epimerase/fuculose-1-phosphate aldolase
LWLTRFLDAWEEGTVTIPPNNAARQVLCNLHGPTRRGNAMNINVKVTSVAQADISPVEWQARVDLAAVYRLIAHYGWGDVIYNHSSMRVPGEERSFLIKRHELLYEEVKPSNLVKVSMDDDLDEAAGVNRPGFTLHGGVLSARPDVNCAVHVHTEIGLAIAGLEHGLRMVSQPAVRFYNRIGYHDYEGLTEDFAERPRINKALGKNRALIMHNHGLLTVGRTAREAFVLMKYLIEAADIQLKMEATGGALIEISAETCEKTARQYEHHDAGRGAADWPAYLRLLDRIDASWPN